MFKIESLWRDKQVFYDVLSGTFNQEGTVFINAEDAQALATHLNTKGMSCWVERVA